jgi:ABC-type dipeptide/oligopeptide/nickel transport system ATPase subunit
MNKIKQIKLKHFKFFYGEVSLDLERQNALIFGENGSGKSSLYWALYTFLQSVFKDTPQNVQKYFNLTDQSLKNRFAPDLDESYIKIVFEDDQKSTTDKMISNTTVNTKTGTLIQQATQGSELINYKLLSKIHDFKNPFEIDLFPIMDQDTFMFITFREILIKHDGTASSANAQEWWNYIKNGLHPRGRMHEAPYQAFVYAVNKFNEELKFYLDSIIESVNEYLKKFNEQFTVSFSYKPCSYDAFMEGSTTSRNRKTIAPKIYLHARFNHSELQEIKQQITRPHTFLNEAKLTAIALSIRFAMLDQKIDSSHLPDDTPKFLVLDDVLISLDMSNRERVLDIILQEFTSYQLIILTHDRNFFELLRHRIQKIGQKDWKYIEMFECEKDSIPQPYIKDSDTYLAKAEKYFYDKEYETAGNFLRKEAEAFCKDFLPKKNHFTSEYNLHDLNGLIKQLRLFAKNAGLDLYLFDELDSYRKFVLNPTSHDSYDVPKFNSEIEGCLNNLKELRQIRNEPFLKRGSLLEFELTSDDGNDLYKFEIKLEDDFRLLKEPSKDSVISKGMINYWVTLNGTRGSLKHGNESLKSFYEKNYSKSDKTKNQDFWQVVLIKETGDHLESQRSL